MDFNTTNGATAWSHWLAQFRDSPKLRSLVHSLYWGMDEAAKTASELFLERWLDQAEGVQLDGIGEILGQSRMVLAGNISFFGFEGQTNSETFGERRFRRSHESGSSEPIALLDSEYRYLLRWKIEVNKGRGTAPDIARALNAVFGTQDTRVQDAGNGKINVWVEVITAPDNPIALNIDTLIPTAGGVGFDFLGFLQPHDLITDNDEPLLTDAGDILIAEFYKQEI